MAQQKDYLVYMHRNRLNNKVYIGQTHQNPVQRWGKNGNGYSTSPHFYAAIQKYGWDNFQHIIIKTGLTAKQADQLQCLLIEQYNATDLKFGYNIRKGGQHGYHYSIQQKEKLSQTIKNNSHNYNGSKKVRCKQTNMIFGTIADAQRWSNTSHIGDVLAGKRYYAGRNPITGQKLSWELAPKEAEITILCKNIVPTKFKKLENNTVAVICLNTGQLFFSIKQAANWCNLKDTSGIIKCCHGQRKTAGKHPVTGERLQWKYVNQ